jgi:ankyrin repeat protein
MRTVINPARALIAAAQKNDQAGCLEMLKCNSIEINLPDEHGNTALHYCVQQNNVMLVPKIDIGYTLPR